MKYRLFIIFAACSLFLCIGVCVMWVRNFWVSDLLDIRGKRQGWQIQSERNILYVNWSSQGHDEEPRVAWWSERHGYHGPPLPRSWGYGSFRYGDSSGQVLVREWWIPHWALALATGAWPGVLAVRWRRRKREVRSSAGLCWRCGYDLRATPGRCPECGAVALGNVDSRPADEVKQARIGF
jgi:hypothetical protein